jgi:DNA-directed RNA polymerase subunit RPC12/RpoP
MIESHQIIIDVSKNLEQLDLPNDLLRYTKKSTSVRELSKEQQKNSFEGIFLDFSSSSSLIQELKCISCNLEFDSSRSYRSHMRDHGTGNETTFATKINNSDGPKFKVEEKPKHLIFDCNQCEKKFSTKFALNAHKKFKHGVNIDGSAVNSKRKVDKQLKFDVECEICNFSSFRRDYVEHHIKQAHKGEFNCALCARQLSNYNYFLHHMSLHTFESSEEEENFKNAHFKCSLCDKCFRFESSKVDHENTKHSVLPQRNFFCQHCNVNYHSKANFDVHLEGYKHKNLLNFLNGLKSSLPLIKIEPNSEFIVDEDGPSVAKKPRLEECLTNNEDTGDKLDYLKFLEELPNGNYKCGICGKTKMSRKFLLHHLKQHQEIPTFNCQNCPERFVFKKKYDKHVRTHKSCGLHSEDGGEKELIVNEHPKFQENAKTNEIRCETCKISFKLTIMMNKHNTTWHSDENPNKNLSMTEQKLKSKEGGTIKLHRCNLCSETYYKSEKLVEHMLTAHNSKFVCDKCNLTFIEEQFLLNHQKLFCIYRSTNSISALPSSKDQAKLINEQ